MRADSNQPHYAPSSVGGLMDPSFLRSARWDADGGHRSEPAAVSTLWTGLQTAVRQATLAIRRAGRSSANAT